MSRGMMGGLDVSCEILEYEIRDMIGVTVVETGQ